MKKIITALLSFSTMASFGQTITNGDFEQWEPGEFTTAEGPVGWTSYNDYTFSLGGVPSVSKSATSQSGSFAAQLRNVRVTNNGVDTIIGGTLFTTVDFQGKPLPGALNGSIQTNLATGEKAIISFGYLTIEDGDMTINVLGVKSFTGTTTGLVPFSIPTNTLYYPERLSDQLAVTINSYDSWKLNVPAAAVSASSSLILDNIKFEGTVTDPTIKAGPTFGNADFTDWTGVESVKIPQNWFSLTPLQLLSTTSLDQSNDAYSGPYALRIGIDPNEIPAGVYTFFKPEIGSRYINGYTKFSLGAGDTVIVALSKYTKALGLNNDPIDTVVFTGSQPSYKSFTLNFGGKISVGDTLVLQIVGYNEAHIQERLEATPFALFDNFSVTSFPLALEEEIDVKAISIAPNPSSTGIFTFQSPVTASNIQVYDVLGNKVNASINYTSTASIIDISHLPKGIYFVKSENSKAGSRIIY